MQGVNDVRRCARSILERLCGQCGQPLGYWIAFIGDDECVARREFLEPPGHEDCLRYAMSACPYLSSAQYESRRTTEGVIQVADRPRPARMALYVTRDYRPKLDSDMPMAIASAPRRLEWF